MLVKDYSLLCNYREEFPKLKAFFMKSGIPFEPSQFNSTMTFVVYSGTQEDHWKVLEFTFTEFGW